jgi:outer membrane protein TolC
MQTPSLIPVPRRRRGRHLALLLLLLAASSRILAGPSLADAVAAALERHPDTGLAQARLNLGHAIETRATQLFADGPALNVKYQTDAIGGDNGYREWEGGVELPLWLPGQRSAYHQEAEQTLVSADALARAQQLEVAGEVRERFWEWALARSLEKEAGLAHDSAKELERDIARRVDAGELPTSDLLLAQKEAVSREDALQQAKNLTRQAEKRFQQYTGLGEMPAVELEDAIDPPVLPGEHPALALASAQADRARAARDRVAAERQANPSLWLGGKSSRDVAGAGYDSAVGVEVTIPFGRGTHAAPAIAEAEEALTGALADRQRTLRELNDSLSSAALDHERAVEALGHANRVQALAEESLRLSRRAFDLGETDLLRLLQARNDALSARNQLEARRLEVGRAVARLNQVLGVIPR